MEQEQTYSPDKERNLDELHHHLDHKAEKLFNSTEKYGMLTFAVSVFTFLFFEALERYFNYYEKKGLLFCAIVCAFIIGIGILYVFKRRYYNAMMRAVDAEAHVQAAKKFKRTVQSLRYTVSGLAGLLSGFLCGHIIYRDVTWYLMAIFIVLIITMLALSFKRNAIKEKDFGNAIRELKERYQSVD